MATLLPIPDFRWPTIEFSLALVVEPLDAIAARLGLPLEPWDEEGLGPARGVAVRLPSGRPVLLRELEYAARRPGATAPDVELAVDAADLGELGVGAMLAEALAALGVSSAATAWVQDPESQGEAARRGAWAAEYLEARRREHAAPSPLAGDTQR